MRVDRHGAVTAAVVLSVSSLSASALAQEAGADRAQSFKAVEGAVEEDVPGGPLMITAYGIIWALLLLYLVRLARMQQRTQADVQRLERLLGDTPSEQG